MDTHYTLTVFSELQTPAHADHHHIASVREVGDQLPFSTLTVAPGHTAEDLMHICRSKNWVPVTIIDLRGKALTTTF